MDLVNNLLIGFQTSLSLMNLGYALMGCALGTLIGVLPGLGPIATIAMLLPSMYTLEPTSALIMLAGIYYGAQYGGSTTAILINVPGEASSVVTALDGYQMSRQGRAGAALAVPVLRMTGCMQDLPCLLTKHAAAHTCSAQRRVFSPCKATASCLSDPRACSCE